MKKMFVALFIVILGCNITGCQRSENLNAEDNGVVITEVEKNGFVYVLKSKEEPFLSRANAEKSFKNSEQFYLSVSKGDKKIEAILVKENIDEESYILYHYTIDQELFAILSIKNDILLDVKLQFNHVEAQKSRGLADWYECANEVYSDYKDWYDENHPMACDLGDLFFGACTVGGILGASISCL